MNLRVLAVLLTASPLSCLPNETRAVPGALVVRSEAREPYGPSFARMGADGWSVQVDQLYVTLGGVELEGEACEAYSEATYSRVLDLTRAGPQKVSLSHGLGDCQLAFAAAGPRWNTLAGDGVPADVVDRFRTAGDGDATSGVSVYLAGEARRDRAQVRFEWPFRVHLTYRECRVLDSANAATDLALVSGEQQQLDIEVDAFALFRAEPSAQELHFAPFAEADRDADGNLTLAELRLAAILDDPLGSRLRHLLKPVNATCATFELCERDCDER